MAEILTESFCERCGTRYTFETVQGRGRSLNALGTLGRGLKHFVVMPDSSFDEAMAVARSETEQRTTNAQLEAFHRTFNFCLSCRQYTCADCWNAVEGRCLTCSPLPEAEVMQPADVAPVMPLDATPLVELPAIDVEALVSTPADAEPEAPEVATPAGLEPATSPEQAAEVAAEPLPEAQEPELLLEAEPVAEAEREPMPEAEPTPEPVAAVALDPEPASPPAAPQPVAFPEFLPGRSLDEEIAAYEVRIAALADTPAEPLPPIIVAATPPPFEAPVVRAQRPAQPRVVPAAPIPAAVASPSGMPGTCRSCGLSLSASARFCRRCGASQVA